MYKKKTINITEKQDDWLEKSDYNFSKVIRNFLDFLINNNISPKKAQEIILNMNK